MEINLYTTNCPKCKILEKKLEQKGLEFNKIEDFDVNDMIQKGFSSAPILEVNGKFMNFENGVKWLKDM